MTLSCVVQHCGENWTGNWTHKTLNATSGTVEEGGKLHFSRLSLSKIETQLNLTICSVSQSDAGSYKCSVMWKDGSRDEGHWTHLNVTRGTYGHILIKVSFWTMSVFPFSSSAPNDHPEVPVQRKALHRLLICAGAFLCLPVFLGLARCLGSKVKPRARPRTQAIYEVVQEDRSHQPPQRLPQPPVPMKRTNPPHKGTWYSPLL